MTTGAISERLCALLAAQQTLDPIGVGSTVTRLLAFEMPPPWSDSIYAANPDGTILERMNAIRTAYFQRMEATGNLEALYAEGYPVMQGIAPDPEWSEPGVRRVLLCSRPPGAFGQFDIAEYRLPEDSLRLVDFARAVFEAPERLDEFADVRVPHGGHREFFVCTHGQVDICCAKFGIPLYQQARRAYPRVRAWRMTHFGGHRYAPTAWEFPSGYKWAFLDEHATERVIERDGHPSDLSTRLRGWSGISSKVQLLDRAGLQRFGWDWLDFARSGNVIEADEDAQRWRVRLDYRAPTGKHGAFEGVVVVARHVPDAGCGIAVRDEPYPVPEYRLESLDESPAPRGE